MEKLYEKIEKLLKEKDNILENIVSDLKDCEVIDDIVVYYTQYFGHNPKIDLEIKLKCGWTNTLRLKIYKNKNYRFSTSSGGINDETKFLEEIHIATGCLLKFVKNFDYNIFDELENLEIKKLREEIAKKEYEQKLSEIKKDLIEVDIDDLIKKAEKDVVEFYTLDGLYLERNTLHKENRRFKLNGRVIAKNKIKNVVEVAYEKE